MYLFFDKNGTLLEIVNDSALRQYNQDANKMYVYIQDEDGSISGKIAPSIVGLTHRYKKSNGEIVNGTQILRPSDGTKYKDGVFEYKEIPFNRKRDLKHFSYGRKYEFFVVDVPSGTITPVDYEDDGTKTVEYVTEGTVFDVAGTVLATLTTICDEQTSLVLERFAFAVEESVPAADGALSGSQFAWLIGEIIRMGNRIDGYYDYDKQNNRPIINVDMDSPDFIAKASNYYRHIGENSAEHRNGLIYYCPEDGTLVEIDGGTSLNLNGQYTEEATVYAPTNGGDNTGVKVLVPHGNDEEPTWERLSVSSSGSVTSAGVTYSIELGGNSVGTITLPKETYIEDITFNGSTKIVTFKYNGESGRGEKTVDLSKLVDVYTAGNGLQKSGNEFSIKTNSSYLSTSSQGLSVNASSIAGLAQIYLNGSRKTANSNQFYAPTTYHTSNSNSSCWVLVPKGINTAPVWERIYVEKSGLTYTLKLGNYMIGKIELTQEIYLDDVKYNSDTNKLVFTYNTASGQSAIEVDLTDLVDMYDAGLGLEKVGNKFNVKIAPNSEKYLKATAEGLVFDESALPIGGGGGTATGNGGTFIAKTEDEMTALLKPENVGALVSYMGEGSGAVVGTPPAVGETIDNIYFNTSVEPDLIALAYSAENGAYAPLIEGDNGGLSGTNMSVITDGAINAYCVMLSTESNGVVIVYSTDDFEFGGVTAKKGWNINETSWVTQIVSTSQQDLWSGYISKEPFAAGGGAYKKDSVYLVTEFKPKHSDIKAGDTIDKLYFDTSVTPDLSALTYEDGFASLVEGNTDGILIAMDLNAMGTSGYVLVSMQPTSMDILYASEAMEANPDLEMPSASKGWNDALIIDGAYTVNANAGGVAAVNQQDLWSGYISKDPFATEITTKKIDCESNLIVAKSETEFNNALVVDNIGKLISYNDELFVVAENKKPEEDNNVAGGGTPIAVGDTVDTLYFDTSVTPDLTKLTANAEGYAQLITSGTHGDYGVFYYDMSLISGGSINAYCLMAVPASSGIPAIIYSTASFDMDGVVATEGWNIDQLDWQDTVAEVSQQDFWGSYISKEPFSSGAAVGTPITVGETVETLYFDTSNQKPLDGIVVTKDGYSPLIAEREEGDIGLMYYDMPVLTGGEINGYALLWVPPIGEPVPVYATEAFEMDGIVVQEGWNVDQVTYGGVVGYIDQQDKWSPYISSTPFTVASADGFVVGQTVDNVYLNINEEIPVEVFEGLTGWEGGIVDTVKCNGDCWIQVGNLSTLTEGAITGYIVMMTDLANDEYGKIAYSTTDFDFDDVSATQGWQSWVVEKGGVIPYGGNEVYEVSNEQNVLLPYISPKPFESEEENVPEIIAKKIGGGSGNISIALNGDKTDDAKFYAPVDTREKNYDNSTYVLTPNGEGAPKWEQLRVENTDALNYNIKLGDKLVGNIRQTQEIYLDSVNYNQDTKQLNFVYNTASGKSSIPVDLTDLAGGNIALPESHAVTFGGTSWTGAWLNGINCYSSTISLTDFGFTSDITSGGSVILSPYGPNDAKLLRRYGVFYSSKYEHNDTVQIYAQSPEVMLSFPEIKFNMTYIPSGNTSTRGAVIVENIYDGVDVSMITLSPSDWTACYGDVDYNNYADDFLYYQSPIYYIDYTSYAIFMPADANSQKELLNCGAYDTMDLENAGSGAHPWAIRLSSRPITDIVLKKMTIWTAESIGVATLNIPKIPSLIRVQPTSQEHGWIDLEGRLVQLGGKIVEIKAETETTKEEYEGSGMATVKTQHLVGPVIFPNDYVPSGHVGQCSSTILVVNGIKMWTDSMGYANFSGIDGAKYYCRIIN